MRRVRVGFLVAGILFAPANGMAQGAAAPADNERPASPAPPVTSPATPAAPQSPASPTAAATTVKSSPPVRAPGIAVRRSAYSLRQCLALAEKNYPKVHEARARLAKVEAELDEAHTAPYSQFNATAGLTVAPPLRGTAVYSPNSDVSIDDDLSLAWQLGIEGAIPLWTFGKISNLVDAAEAQVKVGEHAVKKEKNEVSLSVRKAYYGAQLARDALALIGEAQRRIDKYLASLQRKVDQGGGDDIELLKLKMNRAELDAREAEAQKQERIALAGLRFLTGIQTNFDIRDEPLRRVPHLLGPLSTYLSAARLYRPEINMARAGVMAREAQLGVERARYFPDLAIALSAKWTRAPGVDDQVNPFARDEANYLRYGAGLVLKWKLDLLPQTARVAQARAELEEQRATERYALGGVAVEVETAFADAQEAQRRLDAYTEATQYAKQWLVKVQQGIDVGTFEDEDIVDPAKEYALKKYALMTAIFDYNVALSKLALATGWSSVAPSE